MRATVAGLIMALVLAAGALLGCDDEDGAARSPEKTVEAFIAAVRDQKHRQVYELLDPTTRAALDRMAKLANAHAGGGKHIQPHDLLALAQELPKVDLKQIEVVSARGDTAEVQLVSTDRKTKQTLKLVRVEGKWYVLPPEGLIIEPTPGPATQPSR